MLLGHPLLDFSIQDVDLSDHAGAALSILRVLQRHQHDHLLIHLVHAPKLSVLVQQLDQGLLRHQIHGECLGLLAEHVARELVQDNNVSQVAIAVTEPVIALARCDVIVILLKH